jgi:adenine-specific DNA-methyltransferase
MLPAQYRPNQDFQFEFQGQTYDPPKNSRWKTDLPGMQRLAAENRLIPSGNTLRYVLFHDDYPMSRITNLWGDTSGADDRKYVVQISLEFATFIRMGLIEL